MAHLRSGGCKGLSQRRRGRGWQGPDRLEKGFPSPLAREGGHPRVEHPGSEICKDKNHQLFSVRERDLYMGGFECSVYIRYQLVELSRLKFPDIATI